MKLIKHKCNRWYGTFHEYSQWTIIDKGNVSERNLRDPKQEWVVIGQVVIQQRICEVCGFTDFKKTVLK